MLEFTGVYSNNSKKLAAFSTCLRTADKLLAGLQSKT